MPNLSDKLHFDSVQCNDAFEFIDLTYCIHNPTAPFGCHATKLTDGEHCNYNCVHAVKINN
ncbi:hypothetical protein SMBr_11900 [Shewanella sp. M-Br]|nr:hypothetical protein SMBr_11900 [Shewanella sp. M-Br]